MISVKTVANNTGYGKTGFCFLSTSDTDAGIEEIIKEMVRYNSTLTEADTRAALSVLDAVVERLLQEGCKVRLPWVDLQPWRKWILRFSRSFQSLRMLLILVSVL